MYGTINKPNKDSYSSVSNNSCNNDTLNVLVESECLSVLLGLITVNYPKPE